ncbi:uncharacterized protein B0I36DRAFT_62074 [Microdochium trichocladiopsis]|uniref:Uncharacterized protein n=1 Tax=Microdochium trichocladiopsis TaxID=1682393 RepID=A0A9P8YDZ6_9PEZI|nr:uncharacterized protein B0I36DRAFT_62074 [Microdochium trichocladiopsis]KAH7037127.1 hypothetical protein B0I36DRAFT_62074 [Microdochium trichocladiopsis]
MGWMDGSLAPSRRHRSRSSEVELPRISQRPLLSLRVFLSLGSCRRFPMPRRLPSQPRQPSASGTGAQDTRNWLAWVSAVKSAARAASSVRRKESLGILDLVSELGDDGTRSCRASQDTSDPGCMHVSDTLRHQTNGQPLCGNPPDTGAEAQAEAHATIATGPVISSRR